MEGGQQRGQWFAQTSLATSPVWTMLEHHGWRQMGLANSWPPIQFWPSAPKTPERGQKLIG